MSVGRLVDILVCLLKIHPEREGTKRKRAGAYTSVLIGELITVMNQTTDDLRMPNYRMENLTQLKELCLIL